MNMIFTAVYSSASSWSNTQEYNYSDYDPDTEAPADNTQNRGTEDYSMPPDKLYVTKNIESKNPYVTRQPIPLKINNFGEDDAPKLNDIMNKINASKIINNRHFSKNAKDKKRNSRKYDLGSNSGYKWMLYREPIAEQKRKIKSNGFHSTKQKYKFVSRHTKPVLSKKSLKKLIKKLPKHGSSSSKYVVEKTGSSKYVVEKNLGPSLQLADFLRAGFPITVLINPTFRANNIQSASVLGYGLRSLLKHQRFSTVKHRQIPENARLVHHIVKRSYRTKFHDHYREYRRRLHKRWVRYQRRRNYKKRTSYRKKSQKRRTYRRKYRTRHSKTTTVYHTGNYKGGYSEAYWSYLQKYYPKIYLHYIDGSYSKENYRTYYKTYLKSTNHVKGYNKRGYRLGSYRSGVEDKGLKTPPKPKKPNTFKLKTEEPHLGNNSCPYAWLEYEGSCYYFSRDELNWYKATVSIVHVSNFISALS